MNLTTSEYCRCLVGSLSGAARADRYRARPTSLYGADGYFEEGLSAEAFRGIVLRALEEAGEPDLSGGEKNQR